MPAPRSVDEFLALVRKSGLVDENRLTAYMASRHATSGFSEEPAKAAGLLVAYGMLTSFQAEQILLGKWRRFAIGKYKVLERLGAGRTASVYLCEHSPTRRLAALKVLPSVMADDRDALRRFHLEARALAALNHPNIVRGYDIDEEEDLQFLVMEYVHGSSLQEIIEKCGPMDVIRAAHYLRQAAVGLQHAHETAELVHRGINPSDILVDRAGVVKIIDLGLARFLPVETPTERLDETFWGMADYVAPEQAVNSATVEVRADIYSLGCTGYFCLTGRAPFTEGTVAQKMVWHQTRTPTPILQLRTEAPAGLAALIERMMAKDPAQRPQKASDVAAALALWTGTRIGPPPEQEMPRMCPAVLKLLQANAAARPAQPE